MKELTNEEKIKRLEYELQKSMKINQKLSLRISAIEIELADLSVRYEEVSNGFNALKNKTEEPK